MRLILLTGAQRGEVLSVHWDQFDLEAAVYCKPAAATKQRRLHRAPISASAAALLRTIRLRVIEHREWVFPGEPLQNIKRFWQDVREKVGLPIVENERIQLYIPSQNNCPEMPSPSLVDPPNEYFA